MKKKDLEIQKEKLLNIVSQLSNTDYFVIWPIDTSLRFLIEKHAFRFEKSVFQYVMLSTSTAGQTLYPYGQYGNYGNGIAGQTFQPSNVPILPYTYTTSSFLDPKISSFYTYENDEEFLDAINTLINAELMKNTDKLDFGLSSTYEINLNNVSQFWRTRLSTPYGLEKLFNDVIEFLNKASGKELDEV